MHLCVRKQVKAESSMYDEKNTIRTLTRLPRELQMVRSIMIMMRERPESREETLRNYGSK